MNYQKPGLFAGSNTEYLQLMQGQQQQQQQGQSQECMPNMPHSNDSSFIQAHGYPSQQPQYQYYSASNTNNNFSYPPLQSTAQAPTAAAGPNEMSPLQPTTTDHNSMLPTSTGHNSMTPTDLMANIGLNPQDYNNSNKPMLTEEHNRSIISPGSWSESPHNSEFLNNTIISSTGLVSLTDATTSVNTGSYRSRKASKCSENNNININNNNNNSQLSEEELKARKKLQNRAAQKAFRERKDNKMKQLEEKLIATETNRQELLKEIEELRKLNMEVNTENKILLQKHNDISENDNNNNNDSNSDKNTNSNFSFPTEDEFFETMVIDSIKNDVNDKVFKHEDGTINEQSFIRENIHFTDESGKQFFTVPATWDYLSELQEIEDFDVYFVMQSLKGKQVCDEHGPSYPKSLIDKFVQEASLQ